MCRPITERAQTTMAVAIRTLSIDSEHTLSTIEWNRRESIRNNYLIQPKPGNRNDGRSVLDDSIVDVRRAQMNNR